MNRTSAAKPRYIQIAESLREKILSGELPVNSQLPGEHQLATEYGTTRVTLRKGLQVLSEQNLILQRRGVGAFVTYKMPGRHYRIAILELAVAGDYGTKVLTELLPVLSMHHDCDFTVLKGEGTDFKTLMRHLQEHHCDGLIAIAPSGSVFHELCRPEFNAIPIVVIGLSHQDLSRAGRTVVDIEPDIIGQGVKYLYDLGHRKIAYFSCESDNTMIQERNADFRRAAERYHLHIGPDYILQEVVPSWYEASRLRVRKLWHATDRPTAIISMGTMFAFGAWQGLMEEHVKVPEEMSLLGEECDDLYNPRLSSMMQPLKSIAEKATDAMMNALFCGGNQVTHPIYLPMSIEERGSCGAPRRDS